MPNIIPFKSLMFNIKYREKLSKLVCPPYDTLSTDDYKEYYNSNKNNIIRLEYPFSDNFDEVSNLLLKYRENSILIKDNKPSIYLCEKKFKENSRNLTIKSLICLVKLSPDDQKLILPHERTISAVEDRRFKLLEHTMCQFTPILSLYKGKNNVINRLYMDMDREPLIDFNDKLDIKYRIWNIDDLEIIKNVIHDLKNEKLYIADGHHRYSTALRLKNSYPLINGTHYALMELIDTSNEEIVIFPTHRIIKNLNSFNQTAFNQEEFIMKCKQYFDIIKIKREMIEPMMRKYNENNTFVLVNGDNLYLLVLRNNEIMRKILPNNSDQYLNLDTTVLHKLIFEHIIKTDGLENLEIEYSRDIEEAINSKKIYGKDSISFILNPTKLSQIYKTADSGETMIQKSTYFYPKFDAGLIMYEVK